MMEYGVTMSTKSCDDAPSPGKAPSIANMVQEQTALLCDAYAVISTINEFLFGERLDDWKDEEARCMEHNIALNTARTARIRARLIDLHERMSK